MSQPRKGSQKRVGPTRDNIAVGKDHAVDLADLVGVQRRNGFCFGIAEESYRYWPASLPNNCWTNQRDLRFIVAKEINQA